MKNEWINYDYSEDGLGPLLDEPSNIIAVLLEDGTVDVAQIFINGNTLALGRIQYNLYHRRPFHPREILAFTSLNIPPTDLSGVKVPFNIPYVLELEGRVLGKFFLRDEEKVLLTRKHVWSADYDLDMLYNDIGTPFQIEGESLRFLDETTLDQLDSNSFYVCANIVYESKRAIYVELLSGTEYLTAIKQKEQQKKALQFERDQKSQERRRKKAIEEKLIDEGIKYNEDNAWYFFDKYNKNGLIESYRNDFEKYQVYLKKNRKLLTSVFNSVEKGLSWEDSVTKAYEYLDSLSENKVLKLVKEETRIAHLTEKEEQYMNNIDSKTSHK